MPPGICSPLVPTAGASAPPHAALAAWALKIAGLTRPEAIHCGDGSAAEHDRLAQRLAEAGTFMRLDAAKRSNSYIARSDSGDVARVEDRTFVCSHSVADTRPTDNWHDPVEMRRLLRGPLEGSMRWRTMYVAPSSTGLLGLAIPHIGVQLTDSLYVVCSMRIMTRMGRAALDVLGSEPQTRRRSPGFRVGRQAFGALASCERLVLS